jgi:SAF domain-containing protein
MTAGEPGAGFGTVYHPEPELAPNGGEAPVTLGQLRSLPRRRRPGMIALAVVLVGAGILASAALYQRQNHQVPVILVASAVPAGSVITSADLVTTSIAAGPGVKDIPARQLSQVTGLVAATALRPGTLLAPSDLTTSLPPPPGEVLVPIGVKPSVLPASGLAPGDHVLVVATPGTPGGSGSGSAGPVLTAPVAGVVEAVTTVPDQDGFDVVDLLVAAKTGPDVADQASTGQIALIVTRRTGR